MYAVSGGIINDMDTFVQSVEQNLSTLQGYQLVLNSLNNFLLPKMRGIHRFMEILSLGTSTEAAFQLGGIII